MVSSNQGETRPGMLSISIKDLGVLDAAYMPFVENGGLFIPTPRNYELDDEVSILLALMDEPTRLPVAGRVVWITPAGAQNQRTQGIGVQFSDRNSPVRKRIEELLAALGTRERRSHTL